MSGGKYIFDGSANSYMTTNHDLVNNTSGYSIIFKGTYAIQGSGYFTAIGGQESGCEMSMYNNVIYFRFAGMLVNSGWTNDGLEHVFVLRGADGESPEAFVDGVLVGTGAVVTDVLIPSLRILTIGAWKWDGTQRFTGELSHAYFYNRKVTDQEVADMVYDIDTEPSVGKLLSYKHNKTVSTWTEDINGADATNVGGVTLVGTAPSTRGNKKSDLILLKKIRR